MSQNSKQTTHPETLALHAGYRADPTTSAVAVPIYQTTSYQFGSTEHAANLFELAELGNIYTRIMNPTNDVLEQRISEIEGGVAALAVSSGQAASALAIQNLARAGDNIVSSTDLYGGTYNLFKNTLRDQGIEVRFVDPADPENFAKATDDRTRAYYGETLPNPKLEVFPIAEVANIGKTFGIPLIVDNTAAPILARPFDHGAAIVVHSLTKYIGGHGDAVGGAVLGAQDKVTPLVTEARVHYGGSMSPFNAWLIARGAATLPIRMRAHEENAFVVAEFLSGHPKVESVIYPGFETHPQHELAKRQMDNFSGMIAVRVKDGALVSEKMMEALQVVHYAVSLGHHRSLIFYMPTQDLLESSFRLSGQARERYESVAGDGLFRLSVGLEDAHDICEDLGRVLD